MTAPRVIRQDSGAVCTLTLNRPDKLNALDTAAFEELDAHLAALEAETGRIGCVVLRGAGRAFSAGADLHAMGQVPVAPGFKPGVVQRLDCLPQPVIAAVHGVCFTGALELALACDFIVADAGARFADTHGQWGLVGAWGITQRLPRRVGVAAAKRLMMTARVIEAEQAHAMGLVDVLAPAGGLDNAVASLAGELMASSWHTNQAVKRLMRETEGLPLAAGLQYEREHHPGDAPDHHERVERFKRRG